MISTALYIYTISKKYGKQAWAKLNQVQLRLWLEANLVVTRTCLLGKLKNSEDIENSFFALTNTHLIKIHHLDE